MTSFDGVWIWNGGRRKILLEEPGCDIEEREPMGKPMMKRMEERGCGIDEREPMGKPMEKRME